MRRNRSLQSGSECSSPCRTGIPKKLIRINTVIPTIKVMINLYKFFNIIFLYKSLTKALKVVNNQTNKRL